jgi:hypothetical protein
VPHERQERIGRRRDAVESRESFRVDGGDHRCERPDADEREDRRRDDSADARPSVRERAHASTPLAPIKTAAPSSSTPQ